MKKLISKIFFVAFGALALVSCNDNNPNEDHFGEDRQSGWIQFPTQDGTTYVVSGLVTEFKVPVTLNAPVNTDGLEFTYTITDVQGTTAGYLTHSGTGVVPKNSRQGYISFNIPAAQQTTCREFLITLTGTSRNNVQVGLGTNEKPITHSVVIGRGRDSYVGNYNVVEGTFVFNTVVTAGEAPNEIVIESLGGWSATSLTSAFLTPVSTNGEILLGNFSNNFLFEDPGTGDNLFGANSDEFASTFDPCTGNFIINYILVDDAGGQVSDAFEDVFTKLP